MMLPHFLSRADLTDAGELLESRSRTASVISTRDVRLMLMGNEIGVWVALAIGACWTVYDELSPKEIFTSQFSWAATV
jgi:hypothetical protein